MKCITTEPRTAWQKAVETLGFGYHTAGIPYWDESAYYSFSLEEILAIEKATAELWTMCLNAVQHVMDEGLYAKFAIPEWVVPYVERTWAEDHPAIYGRFDLCYNEGQIKLLEFNADTPTSLFEAGAVQWFWLQDFDKTKDQFNSIHEKLIGYWKHLKAYLNAAEVLGRTLDAVSSNTEPLLHFSCLKETLEDLTNTEYLRDCAVQAGLQTKLVFVDDIGWDEERRCFVDMENEPINNIFKLYPWEWLIADDFGRLIAQDNNRAFWIEPAWKMILSSKAILPVLWELYPGHPLLLPAYFESSRLRNFVKKPILSREGANINIVRNNDLVQYTDGAYGKEGFVFQELFELPDFGGVYPVLGSWIIGQEPAGMGIREADTLITGNTSRFVPHLIE